MRCPECGHNNMSVNGSVKEFRSINHRYLSCNVCGTIFQTKEEIIGGTVKSKFYSEYKEEEQQYLDFKATLKKAAEEKKEEPVVKPEVKTKKNKK